MTDLTSIIRLCADPTRPIRERRDAFGVVVERFQDMAYGCALGILGDPHLAEDAAQESFLAAWQNLSHLRRAEAFPGWFHRIVRWQCGRFLRKRRSGDVSLEADPLPLRAGDDPHVAFEAAELRRAVRAALETLPEGGRMATLLYYLEEYSHAEIAAFLEISPGAVKKRLHDARKKLEGRLAPLARELQAQAPSRNRSFGGRTMQWIRPDTLTSEYDGFMKGHGTQVWDMLRASAEGDEKTIRRLLAAAPGLANASFAYVTPVHFAVREGHAAVVKLLLEAGADPTYKSGLGWQEPPLAKAKDRGLTEIAAMLETALRERVGFTPAGKEICDAVRDGDAARVVALLDGTPSLVRESDERGNAPLHWAVMTRRLDMIDLLLSRGADINAERGVAGGAHGTADGRRPIHLTLHRDYFQRSKLVAMNNDSALLGYLLGKGAEYEITLAAALGDRSKVREWLAADPGLANAPNSAGFRPLSYAARNGDAELVALLLEHGADPNAPETDAPRGLALYEAVVQGHMNCVRLLVEAGADVDASVESGSAALGRAMRPENPEMISYLCAHGATAGLELHVFLGNIVTVAEMLKLDPGLANAGGDYGALCMAADGKSTDMVELLLRRGADLNRPWYANNYMGYACGKNSEGGLERVKLFLDRGANPNNANWMGMTYLHMQALNDYPEAVEMLLDYGADVNAIEDEYDSTPLGWAAHWGKRESAEILIRRGADVNAPRDRPWARPLAWAERRGFPEIAALLRANGAEE
jgi:RNA polymerase sigma factor (sigma-70 family)